MENIVKKTAPFILLFALVAFVAGCGKFKSDYEATKKQFEQKFDKMEQLVIGEKVTQETVGAVVKAGGELLPMKLEEVYQLSLAEKKTGDYNTIWLRKVMYKYIALDKKAKERIKILDEAQAGQYAAIAAGIHEDVIYLWRSYFTEDRHVQEEIYPSYKQ